MLAGTGNASSPWPTNLHGSNALGQQTLPWKLSATSEEEDVGRLVKVKSSKATAMVSVGVWAQQRCTNGSAIINGKSSSVCQDLDVTSCPDCKERNGWKNQLENIQRWRHRVYIVILSAILHTKHFGSFMKPLKLPTVMSSGWLGPMLALSKPIPARKHMALFVNFSHFSAISCSYDHKISIADLASF